jgi:RimJ/RimL family protein N-acetyltransferase
MEKRQFALKNGQTIIVRQIRRDGAQKLADGLARMSPRSHRMRFLTARHTFTADEVRHLVECDGIATLSLVALFLDARGEEQDPIAVAHFVRENPDSNTAEVGVAVLDPYQRLGIGTILLTELAKRSLRVGITRWTGICSPENEPALKLVSKLGVVEHLGYADSAKEFAVRLHPVE